jgi:hypothetical protein
MSDIEEEFEDSPGLIDNSEFDDIYDETKKYVLVDTENVNTYEKYENLYRYRHDIFHKFVCDSKGIPMGEVKVGLIFSDIQDHPHFQLIQNQTPDSVIIDGINVRITEVTVSYSNYAYSRKINKYALLKKVLEDSGYYVILDVIVLPMGATGEGIIQFCSDHGFNINRYLECLEKINKIEVIIKEIEMKKPNWLYARINMVSVVPEIMIEKADCYNLHDECDRKAFNDLTDLKTFMEIEEPEELTNHDNKMIELMVDAAEQNNLELVKSEALNLVGFWDYHDTMNDNIPMVPKGGYGISISPLPLLLPKTTVDFNRDTSDDEELVLALKHKLKITDDLYFSSIATMNIQPSDKEIRSLKKIGVIRYVSECFGNVKFSYDIKKRIAVDGPGRKKYIKCSDPCYEHVRAQREKTMYITGSKLNLSQLEDMLWFFSRKSKIDDLDNPIGPVWDYLRFVQNVFQEININFLRKELKWNHIIKPTIYPGVYVSLHQGPPYMTGAKNSIVWFRLVGFQSSIVMEQFTSSWIFKKIHDIGNNMWATGWMSSDPHRLNHYIRIYDKVLMAYLAYLHGSVGENNKSLVDAYNNDSSDVLGLISIIYLEDKRCTSKTLQDVRYVVMASVSHCQFWNDLLEKFKDPIRSPLQLYIIRRIIDYIQAAQFSFIKQVLRNSKFGLVEGDISGLHTKQSGANIMMPRVLTRSMNNNEKLIPFAQVLSEMYFTMLFNKDQDDATHSSFQVLEKILKGESNLEKIKFTSGLNTGLKEGEVDDLKLLLRTPKQANQFSRRAIMIASKLQNKSEHNQRQGKVAFEMANASRLVNRTIDEFATFKSSATFKNQKHKSPMVGFMQNPRRRCIEGVYDLQKQNCLTSIDVFNKTKEEETSFQVFKKNQIGGVREILILSLSTRIRINILESYCRVICMYDSREMLTHGDIKNSRFVNIQQDLKLKSKNSVIMHYNFDKKRWGPSFMPIQFIHMFKPFQKYMGKFFEAFVYLLIKHTNKKCFYPDHLLKAWNNNSDRDHSRDPLLTIKKREFLKNSELFFINESNMGQGILHYTSSYFHLCVVSLRDKIYQRLCDRKNIKPCTLVDLVSSDDSYTAQCITDKTLMFKHIDLLLRAQSVVERVLNIETSKSKSSMSPVIGEFNSLFISNLTTFPTLIKFALASVGTFSTDSFNQIVKESFNSMRMLIEQGGSIELYNIAYNLNKKFSERMYHTYPNGPNDPTNIFNIPRESIPYQFGIFPVSNPLSLIMMGPESHNYRILSELKKQDDIKIKKLFKSAHSLVIDNTDYYAADLSGMSDIMVGASSIIAMTRVNRRLKKLWNICEVSRDEVKEIVKIDPLFPLRIPKNLEESIIKTRMKLLQSSAVDAMKITNGSLFFGRISATATAKCFRSHNKPEELKTFRECLMNFIEENPDGLSEDFNFFELQRIAYDVINETSTKKLTYNVRNSLETRMYRKLFLNDMTAKLSNPLHIVLESFWSPEKFKEEMSNSLIRDWLMIKENIPIINESLEKTLKNLDDDHSKAVTKLLLILMRLTGLKESTLKGFIFGSSSRNYEHSAEILNQENYYHNLTSDEFSETIMAHTTANQIDKQLLMYNEFLLRLSSKNDTELLSMEIDINVIMRICSLPTFPNSYKKRLFAMLLYYNLIDNVGSWTTRVGQVIEYWITPQVKTDGKWTGDCNLVCFYGDAKSQIKINRGKISVLLESSKDDIKNSIVITHALRTVLPETNIDNESLRRALGPGGFTLFKGRLLYNPMIEGFCINPTIIPQSRPICSRIIINDGFYDLLDQNGNKFIRCQLGLFQIDKYHLRNNFEDFEINHYRFSDMVKLKMFSSSFNIMMYNEDELVETLHNNTISTNDITQEIINTLQDTSSMYKNIKPTEFIEDFNINIDDVEIDDIYQQILADDEKEGDLHGMDFTDYVDELFNSEIFTRQVMPVKFDPKVSGNIILWNRVLHVKSLIILRLWTNKTFIGRRGIFGLIKLKVNPEIICAAINVYQLIKKKLGGSESPTRFHFSDCLPYSVKFGEDYYDWNIYVAEHLD